MNNKLLIGIILILLLIILALIPYSRQSQPQKTQADSTPNPNQSLELPNRIGMKYDNIKESDTSEYRRFIAKFEQYQSDKDSKKILSLFTSPKTDKEKNTWAWLNGTDAGLSKPRLYTLNMLWYKLNWYEIKSFTKTPNGLVTVGLTESKTYYSPDGLPGKVKDTYYSYQIDTFLEIQPDMKIVRYYKSEDPSKYSGFNNE